MGRTTGRHDRRDARCFDVITFSAGFNAASGMWFRRPRPAHAFAATMRVFDVGSRRAPRPAQQAHAATGYAIHGAVSTRAPSAG
jgi:hypothetical protein